jgi:hypothetical protein
MNVLNVRYDVYGGVPDDLARSELPLSITVPIGSEHLCSYSASRRNYTVFGARVGQFQIGDCALIRFSKMLKELEVLPKLAG